MKKCFLMIVLLSCLMSCIYPYNPDIEGSDIPIVVLEGNIVPGGTSTVAFSRVSPLKRRTNLDRLMGTAWVEDDEGGVYYPSSREPSVRVEIPMDGAPSERKYRLKSEIEGQVYSSDWLVPTAPPVIEKVDPKLSMDSSRVEVAVTLDGGEQGSGYIGVTFDETWEFHADFLCDYYLDTLSWKVSPLSHPYSNYWCWKSNSSTMLLFSYSDLTTGKIPSRTIQAFSRADDRNQKLYSINVKAVTLSEEAYKYLLNMNQISTINGGLFSPNPGEMASNIRCETNPKQHVEGYVTAGAASTYRAFLNSKYYQYRSPSIWRLILPESEDYYKNYYYDGYYPVSFMSLPFGANNEYISGVYWGPVRCIDCVVAGGTKNKPDYWP